MLGRLGMEDKEGGFAISGLGRLGEEDNEGSLLSPAAEEGLMAPGGSSVGRGGLNGLNPEVDEEDGAAFGEGWAMGQGGGGGREGAPASFLPPCSNISAFDEVEGRFMWGGGTGLSASDPLDAATIPLSLPALPSSSSIASNILPTFSSCSNLPSSTSTAALSLELYSFKSWREGAGCLTA